MTGASSRPLPFDAARHLSKYQEILSLPRETLPQLTADATRRVLRREASELRLELIESNGVAPLFLLLPPVGVEPSLTLFGTWHAESSPATPAAVEGTERLALAASLTGLAALAGTAAPPSGVSAAAGAEPPGRPVSMVVAPAASHGSLPLGETLAGQRERLRAPAAFWIRIAQAAPRRRRVFLGSRGRVVLGIWGGGANPYGIRDSVVRSLTEEAYGPRPLDFELLRKLAGSADATEFLEEALGEPTAAAAGESWLRNALFEPRGHVLIPSVRHPDRPDAWIHFETAEGMEAPDIRARVESLAGGGRVETAEALPWDRIGIHHRAIHAAIAEAKERSEGPEIWPLAPWATPSGAFTRALGMPLVEWAVPLPPGGAIRSPDAASFEPLVREIASLLQRAAGQPSSPEVG